MTHPAPTRLADATGLTPLSATTNCVDPQAVYQRLRGEHGYLAPVELEPGVNAWLVMGYPEILAITRQEQLYSRDPNDWGDFQNGVVSPDSGLGPMMFPRDNAYFSNGEKHRRLRAPLDDGIAHIDQRRMRRAVAAMCTDLIAAFADQGEADLVADYAAVVPLLAVAGQFGLDVAQGHELRLGLLALFGSGADSQVGAGRFEEILTNLMRARQADRADDLTSFFIDHPNLGNDFEIHQSMVLMVSAGYETTTTWIAQTLRLMLTDPRFAGRLRGGRLGVDDALDEVLWRDPPMANMPARFALRDVELAGKSIRRGDALILGLAAANADPRIHTGVPWAEMGNRAHLAWSTGPHACPARLPARLITRTAVETALHRLRGVRLAIPAEEVIPIPSPWTRCPASLPVRFNAPLTVGAAPGQRPPVEPPVSPRAGGSS